MTRRRARHPAAQVVVIAVWSLILAGLFQFVIFPRVGRQFDSLYQVGAYLLLFLPVVLLLRLPPRIRLPVGGRRYSVATGAGVAVVGIVVSFALHPRSAGGFALLVLVTALTAMVEEVIFRGFIWQRTKELSSRTTVLYAVNVVAFVTFHLPVAIANHESWIDILSRLVITLVLCALRQLSGGLALPAFVHFAIDMVPT